MKRVGGLFEEIADVRTLTDAAWRASRAFALAGLTQRSPHSAYFRFIHRPLKCNMVKPSFTLTPQWSALNWIWRA